jgi:hypothetical protein
VDVLSLNEHWVLPFRDVVSVVLVIKLNLKHKLTNRSTSEPGLEKNWIHAIWDIVGVLLVVELNELVAVVILFLSVLFIQ